MSELPALFRSPTARATIGDQLRRHARTNANKVAVVAYAADGTRNEWTYLALNEYANRCANAFVAAGVGRGDKVAMMSRNCVEVIAAYFGALKVGAAFSGINPLYRDHEIAYQVGHLEPTVFICQDDFTAVVDGVADQLKSVKQFITLGSGGGNWKRWSESVEAAADTEPVADVDELDVAMIVYTSGTEALPKGVMIPHRNYLISTAPAWSWGVDTYPSDTWLFVMPFHTIAGLGSMTTLLLMGSTLVLPHTVEPAAALDLIEREKVTVIAQTPTFYLAVARQQSFGPDKVRSVRRCMTYGGLVVRSVVDAWSAAGGPDLMWGTYWGQSELSQLGTVGWFRTLDDVPDGDPTFIGRPVSHLEVTVRDPAGEPSEIGELWCRSPSVMLGYFKDPERTAAIFEDGWVRTGDMVRQDDSGNLFFYDRIKDVIKTGGMNVSSQEVERVVMGAAGVERCAVVGMPDEYWSEAVTAFVVPAAGHEVDPAEVINHCKSELAGFKVPKAVHLVTELPIDAQGKIIKRRLRALSTATDS